MKKDKQLETVSLNSLHADSFKKQEIDARHKDLFEDGSDETIRMGTMTYVSRHLTESLFNANDSLGGDPNTHTCQSLPFSVTDPDS